jgi:thiol-disulfide isomerase/thioredoxin
MNRLIQTVILCAFLPGLASAKRAPNLEMKDLSGHTHKVEELRGSIVVLNFWATWCGPCREELPLLARLISVYGEKKIRFVAASADDEKSRGKVAQFAEKEKLPMDVWVGADVDMLQRAGLGNELPATLILDEKGEIIARFQGEAREEELRRVLDWLLSGRVGTAPPPLYQHL